MQWRHGVHLRYHSLLLSLLILLGSGYLRDVTSPSPPPERGSRRCSAGVAAMSTARREELRLLTKDLWYHAFDSYMQHAYPADELKPLTCTGLSRDGTQDEHEINDVMGGYALTLIDALDSFVVLGDKDGFDRSVRLVVDDIHNFDIDARVQVFEVTIRVLGGLLSAHIFASSPKYGFALDWYTDDLLRLARDLGQRLLPAFEHSLTGLPWARVNLRHGLSRTENMETCSAAAGSLLLEFATLSRLTGDGVYEAVARKALFSLWNRRSQLSLLGNTLNVTWLSPTSSTGAGIDSFFEYLAKAYILLGDDEYYRIWAEAYAAVMKHSRSKDGFWYRRVHMDTGLLLNANVDSLSAFFPGLQAMMGDLESAIKSHAVYALLWERFSGSPEVFNTQTRRADSLPWPLRPELVESTLFLYRATKDSSYLRFGERVVHDIANRTKVPCGLAALESVSTGQQQDRMHSFAVSEMLPYLYLLFDGENMLNFESSNGVFTTEGHWLVLDKSLLKPPPKSRKGERQICTRYDPRDRTAGRPSRAMHALQTGVPYRTDMEYARSLTGTVLNDTEAIGRGLWDPSGFCESPSAEDYTITLLFAQGDESEDTSPSAEKVQVLSDRNGFLVRSIQGLRIQATRRMDASGGYDVTKIGPYRVSSSSTVWLADLAVILALRPQALVQREAAVVNNVFAAPAAQVQLTLARPGGTPLVLTAAKAAFGPDVLGLDSEKGGWALFDVTAAHRKTANNALACLPLSVSLERHTLVLAERGSCTFAEKMRNAADAGAEGLIVLGDEAELLVPSADAAELADIDRHIPVVLLPKAASDQLRETLRLTDAGRWKVAMSAVPHSSEENSAAELANTPVVVNSHWLVNCKLVLP